MSAGQNGIRAATARSSITVDKQTRLAVQAVQADMQRAQRCSVPLGEVVGQLAQQWQQSRSGDAMDTSPDDPGAAQLDGDTAAVPGLSPCAGCDGPCSGGQARIWSWIGAALGVGLLALAVASGALRSARRAAAGLDGDHQDQAPAVTVAT